MTPCEVAVVLVTAPEILGLTAMGGHRHDLEWVGASVAVKGGE